MNIFKRLQRILAERRGNDLRESTDNMLVRLLFTKGDSTVCLALKVKESDS